MKQRGGWTKGTYVDVQSRSGFGKFINLPASGRRSDERDHVEQAAAPLGLDRLYRKKKDDGRH